MKTHLNKLKLIKFLEIKCINMFSISNTCLGIESYCSLSECFNTHFTEPPRETDIEGETRRRRWRKRSSSKKMGWSLHWLINTKRKRAGEGESLAKARIREKEEEEEWKRRDKLLVLSLKWWAFWKLHLSTFKIG